MFPIGKNIRVVNSKKGVKELIAKLNRYTIYKVVCKASGGYERLMIKQLKHSNYKVWVVQPKKIRAFITSEGIKD